ncbi:hypothetical protein C8R46DRAFT_1047155 [Mycena filopes]|nr:hypothetical protein C8R46DRAFT_1047155 [Mycena filopes]
MTSIQLSSGTDSPVPEAGVFEATASNAAALQEMRDAMTALKLAPGSARLLPVKATMETFPLPQDFASPPCVDASLLVPAPVVALPDPAIPVASPSLPSLPSVAPAPGLFRTGGPWIAGALYHVVPSGPLLPVPQDEDEDGLWYCITSGTFVGVTLSQALASKAVVGVPRSGMKSHKTQARALAAFNELLRFDLVTVVE